MRYSVISGWKRDPAGTAAMMRSLYASACSTTGSASYAVRSKEALIGLGNVQHRSAHAQKCAGKWHAWIVVVRSIARNM